jgi:hypothetical protein
MSVTLDKSSTHEGPQTNGRASLRCLGPRHTSPRERFFDRAFQRLWAKRFDEKRIDTGSFAGKTFGGFQSMVTERITAMLDRLELP